MPRSDEGLAAGTGLANMNVSPVEDLNTKAYGGGFNANDILSKPGGQLQTAGPLRDALAKATNSAWND